jgi:hypothetical protein
MHRILFLVLYLPEDPEFSLYESRHLWFLGVLLAECGELAAMPEDAQTPPALDWLAQLPVSCRYEMEEAECSLAYVSELGYVATVWDAIGGGDLDDLESTEETFWAVFIVDDAGARLLAEYSILDEEMHSETREVLLQKTRDELPDRLIAGDFTRPITPVSVPEYLFDVENLKEFSF